MDRSASNALDTRRKYFSLLNPTLQKTRPIIDTKAIKNKLKLLLLVPNFNWVDQDVNALWDLIPWNLCILAAMVKEICDVKIVDAYKKNLSEESLTWEIQEYDPDVVGITVLM